MFSASLDSTRCEAVAQRCPLLVTLQPGGLKRVTVEICMERQWNIWVSCVSRAPSSCRDTVEEFLTPTEQKVALVCGDFNINLLSSPRLDATEVVFPSAAPPSVDRKTSCPVRSN